MKYMVIISLGADFIRLCKTYDQIDLATWLELWMLFIGEHNQKNGQIVPSDNAWLYSLLNSWFFSF